MIPSEMQQRWGKAILLVGLLFGVLGLRVFYLNTAGVPSLAEQYGLELEVFYQYPVPEGFEQAAMAGGRSVTVPSVVGASYADAGETLLRAGLRTEATGEIKGRVVRQKPAPGTTTARGGVVQVWLEP